MKSVLSLLALVPVMPIFSYTKYSSLSDTRVKLPGHQSHHFRHLQKVTYELLVSYIQNLYNMTWTVVLLTGSPQVPWPLSGIVAFAIRLL